MCEGAREAALAAPRHDSDMTHCTCMYYNPTLFF